MKRAAIAIAVVSLGAAPGWAVRETSHSGSDGALEVVGPRRARPVRAVRWAAPAGRAQSAWTAFRSAHGASWRGAWDVATGVPARIFGAGIAAPGAVADPHAAAAATRALLADHIELVAPGAVAADFALAGNVEDGGVRTVGYFQHHRGVRVLGGQVSFRFKADRLVVIGSEAMPDVHVDAVAPRVGADVARDAALRWMETDLRARAAAGDVDGPFILPILTDDAAPEYRLVWRARVDVADPIGAWDVYVDALTGEPVAREQTLRFASATLHYDAPMRWWGAERDDHPAPGVAMTVDGAMAVTDDAGAFAWTTGTAASGVARVTGPLVDVDNAAGPDASEAFSVGDGAAIRWSSADDEFIDAQLTTYIHAHIAKAWGRAVSGGQIEWLDQQLQATVNIDATCNAFSDGDAIHFFRAGGGCGNTARIADVVYHEFGHSFHKHVIIPGAGAFDGALSEGISDYIAATITGDAAMGRGFFNDDEPLRHLDQDRDAVWPDDIGPVHTTGLIIGGALWDLRKNLIGSLGPAAGVARADYLFYQALRRSSDIPSMYVEVLLADDDDGNLDNGTPNHCAIDEAFGRHGLADPDGLGVHGVARPIRDGWSVMVELRASGMCPAIAVQSAALHWEVRGGDASGTVDMQAAGNWRTGAIPEQPWGQVVRYRVELALANGEVVQYPHNAAAPWYELFVGDVTPLYCTDFEGAEPPAGWWHELVDGQSQEGADDWQWGAPAGKVGSRDPAAPHSGVAAFGNDLGIDNWNGRYQPNKVNALYAPLVTGIDAGRYDQVRLHYWRWLTVEDGYYDEARILAGGAPVWSNLATEENGAVHHEDREWVFHDVDLTDAVRDGKVQVSFELSTDGGFELGGWTIDDFCIVGFRAPLCGNGMMESGEQCDDGNAVDGDGCDSDCTLPPPVCGNGVVEAGEQCDGSDDCTATCELRHRADDGVVGSCACRAAPSGRGAAWGWLALAALGTALRRRRSRRA